VILAREKVIEAYRRALDLGAATHDEAVHAAAQALGVEPELVEAAVWEREPAC
jgi:hypothetical protein